MRETKRGFLWVVLCTVLSVGFLVLTSCDNEDNIKAQIKPDVPAGASKIKVKVFKNRQKGHFTSDGQVVSVTCQVTLTGVVDGQPFSKTVKVYLESKGAKGASYELDCTDPLLAQFPADANNFTATYTNSGGVSAPLPVTAGLQSVATVPGQQLAAEPGEQLVLFSFPEEMADGDYTLSTAFALNSIRAIDIKPVITGKIVCNGRTYLPPIAPTPATMADVPAITIPVSSTLVDLPAPLDTVSSSVNVSITCR